MVHALDAKFELVVDENAPNTPQDVDILINAAVKFFTYFNLGQTRLLKKASANDPSQKQSNRPKKYHRTAVIETTQSIGTSNNMCIYEGRVRELYQRLPTRFGQADVIKYFEEIYPDLGTTTRINRARAYMKFFNDKEWVRQISMGPRRQPVYVFDKPPLDEPEKKPPAVAEFDSTYAQKAKMLELETYRQQS